MEFIIATIGVLIGAGGLAYGIIRSKKCAQLDTKTAEENEQLARLNASLKQNNESLEVYNKYLQNEGEELKTQNSRLLESEQENQRKYEESSVKLKNIHKDLNELIQQKEIVNAEINLKQAQMDTLTQNVETLTGNLKATARASFEQYCDSLDAEYSLREKELDDAIVVLDQIYDTRYVFYLDREKQLLADQHEELDTLASLFYDTQERMTKEIQAEEKRMRADLASIREELEKIRATRAAALEAQLREEEIKDQATFYTLQINEADKRDISYLQSIEYNLREARPLRMLIWSTFYRDKVNDLAARVGAVGASGIYKITHIDSGISYVGQARDIKERWVTHVKCSLGIDTPVTSQLYQFTREKGIDNFTFEILEKCPIAELNEKEKFYIDLYQTYDYGLNANKGVGK